MRKSLVGFFSRLSALALLCLALAAPILLIGWPVLAQHQQLEDEIATGRDQLGRFQSAAQAEREAAKTVSSQPVSQDIFLGQGNDAALSAALQSRLVEIAAAQNVRLLSSSQLPARDEHGLRISGVRIELRTPIDGVQRILHAIESSRPILFVEVADLRADGVPAPDGQPSEPLLGTTLDVYGVAAPGNASKDASP